MLGAAAATGIPRCRSKRCLAKVAAWAELPRAQVTTRLGPVRRDHSLRAARGPASASACRRTASGASRSSLAIWSSGPTIVNVRRLQQIRLLGLGSETRKLNGAVKSIPGRLNQVQARVWRDPLRHRVRQPTDQCERTDVAG